MARTNMRTPGTQDFINVLDIWQLTIQEITELVLDLRLGTQEPLKDWHMSQPGEHVYYYSLNDYTIDDFEPWCQAYSFLNPRGHIQVITALQLTTTIDTDITHDIEIPGVWLVRVVKID